MKIYRSDSVVKKGVIDSISPGNCFLNFLANRFKNSWINAGRIETAFLGSKLDLIDIKKPVYVCGLARSGTTIALELLTASEQFGTHRYEDIPFIHILYWWNCFRKNSYCKTGALRERAHQDGLMINLKSPEALEEPLWCSFFKGLHNELRSNLLTSCDADPEFDIYYRNHIKKLLFIRGKERYLAKSNYNLTRIPYIARLFPDARFVVMIRHPADHIASLCKQHDLFCSLEKKNPSVLKFMNYIGHYEFGLNRIPINTDNSNKIREISALWNRGEAVKGWALYWREIYSYVWRFIVKNDNIKRSVLVVKYRDLCEKEEILAELFSHALINVNPCFFQRLRDRLRVPSYYSYEYSAEEKNAISEITGSVAEKFGFIM
jgi:hypothetical protein